MRYLALVIVYLMSLGCTSSQKIIKPCNNIFEVTVLRDEVYEGDVLIADSLRSQLKIIFEQSFDDSVYVFIDNSFFQVSSIITNKLLGVSPQFITIDYSAYKKLPKLSFVLVKGKECISFYPRKGKQMAYINYLDGAWSIELSNIMREYR